MECKGKIYISSERTDHLIVHAVSDDLYGVEDGLSVLKKPVELLRNIALIWPNRRLFVFRYSGDTTIFGDAVNVQMNWDFISTGYSGWGFALLLDTHSRLFEIIEYLKSGFFREAKMLDILTRNQRKTPQKILEKVELGRHYYGRLQSTIKLISSQGNHCKTEDFEEWLACSPVIFLPFFTMHGEGIRLLFRGKHRQEVLRSVGKVIDAAAECEDFLVEYLRDIQGKYGTS